MFYKELKRMIFNIPAFIIIIAALAVSLLFTYVKIHRFSKENEKIDTYYKEYMVKLEGELTADKEKFIQNEKNFIDDTIAKEDEMLLQYNENEIDSSTYQQYLNDNFYATEHSASIEKIYEQYQSALRLKEKDISVHLFYDTYWCLYFDMRIITFIQMMIVIALVLSYLSSDYISGMWRMTQTYFKGRTRLFHTRLGVALLSCVGISILFPVVYYAFFKMTFFMPDIGAPIQSFSEFEKFPLHLSIADFLVFISVFRLFAFCLLAVFIFSVTSIMRNLTASFGICGGIVLLPLLFSSTSKIFLKLSFYELFLGIGIMGRSTTVRDIIIFVIPFILFSFMVYIIAVWKQSDLRGKV